MSEFDLSNKQAFQLGMVRGRLEKLNDMELSEEARLELHLIKKELDEICNDLFYSERTNE